MLLITFTVRVSVFFLHCAFSICVDFEKSDMKSSNTNALRVVACQKVFIKLPVYENVPKKETDYFIFVVILSR